MKNKLPKIAIIVSNYNYGEYVMSAIASALEQDYSGKLRVYVVDDGSSDDSWDKIKATTDSCADVTLEKPYYNGNIEVRKSELVYAYRIRNSGASTARNVAMWMAWDWADIFGILDADDEYYSNKVSVLVEKLMEHDEVGVAYADYDIHRTYNNADHMKYEYKYPYCKVNLTRQCIVHSGALIKRGALLANIIPERQEFFDSNLHGPGSEEFIGCTEDYDLWLRLSKSCMMAHVPQSLSYVRETGQNQSLKMTQDVFVKNMEVMQNK